MTTDEIRDAIDEQAKQIEALRRDIRSYLFWRRFGTIVGGVVGTVLFRLVWPS